MDLQTEDLRNTSSITNEINWCFAKKQRKFNEEMIVFSKNGVHAMLSLQRLR
jgi:hypothetical protein